MICSFLKECFRVIFLQFLKSGNKKQFFLTNFLSKYGFYHSLFQLYFFFIPVAYLPDAHFRFFGSLQYLILSPVSAFLWLLLQYHKGEQKHFITTLEMHGN